MSKQGPRKRLLTIEQILGWARLHRETTGKWPTHRSGGVLGAKFEIWSRIDAALRKGLRGLPGTSSLARLLQETEGVQNTRGLTPLNEVTILKWADEHYQRTGAWPLSTSGVIPDSGGENWATINAALQNGNRGLSGGSTLVRLLAAYRQVRRFPPLTREQILAWADAQYDRTGAWPGRSSGPIVDALDETWSAIDMALRQGHRGLEGSSSLALLLAQERKARNTWTLPLLTIEQVLGWADAFHAATGSWPRTSSGPIANANGETWLAIGNALRRGSRGLPGPISLAGLLARERGVRNRLRLPRFASKQILVWADAHRRRTGQWPTRHSGLIPDSFGETWEAVHYALRTGTRGLRGGTGLARLLARYRQRPNHMERPPLSKRKILAWADAYFERHGEWPKLNSGAVRGAPGETWVLIDLALRRGMRNLPSGASLARLLAKKRGVRNTSALPLLSEEQILAWAKHHCEHTGSWPTRRSGPILAAAGETWMAIEQALCKGRRGLSGGSSLALLLARNQFS